MSNELAQANSKLALAMSRMVQRYPFHVAILDQMRVTAEPAVGTLAVGIESEGILLLYNPSFVLATPFAELSGVLLHEVHHCLFGHLTADPAEFPDAWARTVAEEITANEFVSEPLPVGAVRLEDFPDLPPHESTAARYERLTRHAARVRVERPRESALLATGNDPEMASQGEQGPVFRTVDDHSVRGAGPPRETAEDVVATVVDMAVMKIGFDRLPTELREALATGGIGVHQGAGHYEVRHEARPQLHWRRVLRRYVGQALAVRPTFGRPPRRFPELVGILPARQRRTGHPRVMAVIDTSASITDAMIEMINAELAALARRHAVVVVECDAAVQAAYPYRRLRTLSGRGGTDFRPPLTPAYLRQQNADLVIFFTDGLGPAPTRPPSVPVIWCLTPAGRRPASWGRVVYMKKDAAGAT